MNFCQLQSLDSDLAENAFVKVSILKINKSISNWIIAETVSEEQPFYQFSEFVCLKSYQ